MPFIPDHRNGSGFLEPFRACARAACRAPDVRPIDFQLDLGIQGEGEELLYFRSHWSWCPESPDFHPPVDGITSTFTRPNQCEPIPARQAPRLRREALHPPEQVATVNECFGPTPQEIAWATRIVEATANTNGEAISLDGEMIDRPVIARAQAILALKNPGMRHAMRKSTHAPSKRSWFPQPRSNSCWENSGLVPPKCSSRPKLTSPQSHDKLPATGS